MSNICIGGVSIHSGLANFAIFLLRVFLGIAMLYTGFMKIPPSEQLVDMVAKIGLPIPSFFAVVAGLLEIVGGACLLLGIFTRWGAAFIMFVVLMALIFVHTSDPFRVRFLPLLVFFTSLQFLLIGAGKISIDALWRKRKVKENPPPFHE